MQKPFDNFEAILNDFDGFCDEFETRAAEAFMKGDSNNGNIVRAATDKLGGETPSVVTEIREPGDEGFGAGETHVSVSQTECE